MCHRYDTTCSQPPDRVRSPGFGTRGLDSYPPSTGRNANEVRGGQDPLFTQNTHKPIHLRLSGVVIEVDDKRPSPHSRSMVEHIFLSNVCFQRTQANTEDTYT